MYILFVAFQPSTLNENFVGYAGIHTKMSTQLLDFQNETSKTDYSLSCMYKLP